MPKKLYLEYSQGSSHKFWEIQLDGSEIHTRWGRIGSDGQTTSKSFGTAAQAQQAFDKQVESKQSKGYVAAKKAAAKQATAKQTTAKKAAAKKPAAKKPAAKKPASSAKQRSRRFVSRVLHVQGDQASAITKIWRSSKTTEAAITKTLALLGDAVVTDELPAWLKLDDEQSLGTVVHMAPPAFVANPDDEDELWHRSDESPMVILTARGKLCRTDGKGGSKEEKLDARHIAHITAVEFSDSNPISNIAWLDDPPGTPALLRKWTTALAKAAGGELDPYDAAELGASTPLTVATVAVGPSAHGHGGPRRTNAVDVAGPLKKPKKLWVGQGGGGGEYGGDPLACDGRIFGTDGNWVEAAAFDPKGKRLWSTKLSQAQNWSTGSTCVVADVAYFPTKEGVHALEARTGNKLWLARCKGQASSPLVADGLVIFGGLEQLIAVAPETGRKKWAHTVGAKEQVGAPAHDDGIVYAVAIDTKNFKTSRIVALEAATGKLVFELKTRWLHKAPPPMVVDGQVLCKLGPDEYGALHPKTGKLLWSQTISVQEVAAAKGILVVRNNDGLRAYDIANEGKLLWADALEDNYSIGRSGPFIAGDAIYIIRTTEGDLEGRFLQAVELTTGKQLWRLSGRDLRLDPFSWNCTPWVHDGVIYAQTYHLVALR